MGKEGCYYEVIRTTLAEHLQPPYPKEAIKAKIAAAVGCDDYIAAITAYLWGAYNNCDRVARVAFKEIFFDDLRIHNQAAFYFFSFYFLNDFKRTGIDRRTENDRREAYSVDFFSEKIIERRQRADDRRGKQEKRLNWTRVTEWVSVPFTVDDTCPAGDTAEARSKDKLPRPDNDIRRGISMPPGAEIDHPDLNAILSSLIFYFDSYVKQGKTGRLDGLNREIFQRAQEVMVNLGEIQRTG